MSNASKASFVYVTYIQATPEKVWNALQDPEMTKDYWGRHRNRSDWKKGSPWQHESYDHVIRDGPELGRIVRYIVNNPVVAGLCGNWEDWHWTYVKNDLLEMYPGW